MAKVTRIYNNAKCSECRDGEIDEKADFYIEGVRNGKFFKKYVCSEHLQMLYDDGVDISKEVEV